MKTTLLHHPGHTPAEQTDAGFSAFSEPVSLMWPARLTMTVAASKSTPQTTCLFELSGGAAHHSGEVVAET